MADDSACRDGSNQNIAKQMRTLLQRRKTAADECRAIDARNVRADVDGSHDIVAARGDGNRDRAETGFEFFVDNGVAVLADLEDGLFYLGNTGEGFGRIGSRFETTEVGLELVVGKRR